MLVSIITPTYNRADFIGEAIKSVLSQTITDFELLIVDDGSQDDSREIIQKFVDQDSRVKYFYQENQGQSVARNLALGKAGGEFICFLDSDNYWPENRLEKSLAAFEKFPDADIVYGDCITINEAGDIISHDNMKRYSGRVAALLLKDNFISMNTTMTRRKCFNEMGGMSGKRRVADDYDLWLKFSAKYVFQYIPEYLAYYRVMENQISSNKRLRFETNEKIVLDFVSAYPDALTPKERKEGLAAFYCRKARYYAAHISKKEALPALLKAARLQPFALNLYRTAFRVVMP